MSPEDFADSPESTSEISVGSPASAIDVAAPADAHAAAAGGSITVSSPTLATATAAAAALKKPTTATTTTTAATAAAAKKNPKDPNAPPKVTKRRAARACVSCRARKVRCDVVEGAPCGNCRWDNVECIVQESRRRRKNLLTASTASHVAGAEAQLRTKPGPIAITSSADLRRPSDGSLVSMNGASGLRQGGGAGADLEGHVPHMIYQRLGYRHDPVQLGKLASADASQQQQQQLQQLQQQHLHQQQQHQQHQRHLVPSLGSDHGGVHPGDIRTPSTAASHFLHGFDDQLDINAQVLEGFIRPLPTRIAPEDVRYLHAKGALSLPPLALQNALLQAYIEYVHPYMPLIDLHDFLAMVSARDGHRGQISLFLYQAIMFAGTAFVDTRHLREAGFTTRKAARKAFFQKTRLLYDFDYESDRLILVQALLLMTYWYETPDDQKDTWHWMGVAISLAHTIGLHRDPAVMSMGPRRQKLWKRVWWSCFMRDRLVALGMRRPTRIKDEDFDVPMLEESDFEIEVLSDDITVVPAECTLMRDLAMQRDLAVLCIAKAQLCICVSHMLRTQYSVLVRDRVQTDNTVNSTMMLFPNKKLDNMESVNAVDLELLGWVDSLPPCCQYRPLTPLDVQNGRGTIALHRTLLHMVYHTTVSALHRPQFLPSSPSHVPTASRQVQEMSRLRVRDAAMQTTRMAAELHQLKLERFLPTTGVTGILPAMIIHLLEMKNPVPQARERATRGFRQCMKVLEKLRDIYAAADYAVGFLEAALRKAAIDLNASAAHPATNVKPSVLQFSAQTPPPDVNAPYMTASESSLFHSATAASHAAQHAHVHHQQHHPAATLLSTLANANGGAAAGPGALEFSATSPPQTERDLDSAVEELTPSASGTSEQAMLDNLDHFMAGQTEGGGDAEFDWNAVTGTDFDVDQWLQFPAEGGGGAQPGEDALMTGVYSTEPAATAAAATHTSSSAPTMTPEEALTWAMRAEMSQEAQEGLGMDLDGTNEVAVGA